MQPSGSVRHGPLRVAVTGLLNSRLYCVFAALHVQRIARKYRETLILQPREIVHHLIPKRWAFISCYDFWMNTIIWNLVPAIWSYLSTTHVPKDVWWYSLAHGQHLAKVRTVKFPQQADGTLHWSTCSCNVDNDILNRNEPESWKTEASKLSCR